MEKNIVEVVINNKGEVIEKVADYIGVHNNFYNILFHNSSVYWFIIVPHIIVGVLAN